MKDVGLPVQQGTGVPQERSAYERLGAPALSLVAVARKLSKPRELPCLHPPTAPSGMSNEREHFEAAAWWGLFRPRVEEIAYLVLQMCDRVQRAGPRGGSNDASERT